jgi:4'-phosphopantetheinyl transferase
VIPLNKLGNIGFMIVYQNCHAISEAKIELNEGEVHVWQIALNISPDPGESSLKTNLSPDERLRAGRFHRSVDRYRFIKTRGMLRKILAQYLSISAEHINFLYSAYGKPALVENQNHPDLRFNLSHSNEIAMIAITRRCEIGIDIEFIREDFASREIAEDYFSQMELDLLSSVPERLQTRAFFNCWTRKEAYIKAIGEGLSHPLNKFAVSLTPGSPPELLHVDDNPLEITRWRFYEPNAPPDYVAALVVERQTEITK